MLQRELAKEKGVTVDASLIRKALGEAGYKWLRRIKKPKYSKADCAIRLTFANKIASKTDEQLEEELDMSLDGVVVVMPPDDVTSRENFCKSEITHVWRKPSEAASPDLVGFDKYQNQAPLNRCIPFWGGIGYGGVAAVLWHDLRKIDSEDWAAAVDSGKLVAALRSVTPGKLRGPWTVLPDNESFLRAEPARSMHIKKGIKFWRLPPRSPDLNPVEKFWGWLRRLLRAKDLADLVAKRPTLDREQYKKRIQGVLKSDKAKQVAINTMKGLKRVAKQVQKNKGGPSRG
jgi:hypothetical protein